MSPDVLRSHELREGSRIRLVRYRSGERHRPHAHAFSSLTLVLGGAVEERVGRDVQRGTAFRVAVKPAGVEHADDFGDAGALVLRVELSARDESCADSSGCWERRWRWLHPGATSRALTGMIRALREPGGPWSRQGMSSASGGSGSDEHLEDLLLEAIGSMPRTPPAGRVPPEWLIRARDALEESCVPTRTLAEREGVHPVALARMFRLHFGTSPSAYRRQARARRAAALLTDTRQPLAEVALEAGYSDQAHFTRDLRTVLGVTPFVARSLARPR